MILLVESLGDLANGGDAPEPENQPAPKKPTLNIDPKKTIVRLALDDRRWKIQCIDASQPEALYIIVKPYRCPQASKKFCRYLVVIPNIDFKKISDEHAAVTYRSISGKTNTVIMTSIGPNRLKHCRVTEIFTTLRQKID